MGKSWKESASSAINIVGVKGVRFVVRCDYLFICYAFPCTVEIMREAQALGSREHISD